jgi:NAD+ diphosphatase
MRPALKGLALLNWLEGARFCGACGTELVDAAEVANEDLRGSGGRVCPACGRPHFPRISPAVIVLVRNEGKALLAHNVRFPAGRFGLLAGFVDAGETLEEAAVREVREEAGIEIRNLRYARSQPWPFPDSLMLAFTADWKSGEARPDGVEIAELRWCGPDELPAIPPPGSVARSLIDEFVSGA